MNKINRKLEYLLIALKHMQAKSPGQLTTAKEIANAYSTPFDVTSRVLQVLAQKGVLRSEQGAHGGYQIVRDLGRVTLFELLEYLDGPIEIAKCLHETEVSCDLRESCNIVSPMQNLNKKLSEFYKNISVAELLESKSTSRVSSKEKVAGLPSSPAAAIEAGGIHV